MAPALSRDLVKLRGTGVASLHKIGSQGRFVGTATARTEELRENAQQRLAQLREVVGL